MHTIQFDPQTEQALARQAAIAGVNVDQLIREAVAVYLEEQEDIREAEEVLARIAGGKEETIPWETVKASHGL